MSQEPHTADPSSGRAVLGHALSRVRGLAPRRADYAQMRVAPTQGPVAGITVGVVALPLALGFGVTSGLGAGAGLITAIIAGTLAAVFGGSNVQVSGPTGAMTVVLVPIVAVYGPNGVLIVGLMAGALLIGMAFAGVGPLRALHPAARDRGLHARHRRRSSACSRCRPPWG